jgi:hypothetical protein
MPAEIRIYFEGHELLKPGFDSFFAEIKKRARERCCGFALISSKSGAEARRDFDLARGANPKARNILLIDSEGPLHRQRAGPHANSIFWMVEMMEAWFHADKNALAEFYGDGFKSDALKGSEKAVEGIPKRDLESGLTAATRNTKKGDYFRNKTSHGPKLLAKIDPKLVSQAAPNCALLFQALIKHLK